MSVKRLCDCCGQEILKDDFMVLNLLPYKSIRGVSFAEAPVSCTSKQELCDHCAAELCEHYRMMKATKQGKTLKRVCLNCGHEDNDEIVCPVCKSQNWSIEEE